MPNTHAEQVYNTIGQANQLKDFLMKPIVLYYAFKIWKNLQDVSVPTTCENSKLPFHLANLQTLQSGEVVSEWTMWHHHKHLFPSFFFLRLS